MRKRICLAGFDGGELAALQAAMGGISGAWDCVFAPDMPAALAALQAAPCDAIVANMKLPDQSGAELLRQAHAAYPSTMRFIVGDVADQALIINCIGGTHQFIARPFHPPEVISTIQRALALDAWLSSDALRKLTPRLQRLPSLPSTYFELLKQIESPNANLESIAAVIARDPAVTARLLQMVNSAAFALGQKVTDPKEAVALLGIETVKSLVLCLQVFSQTDEAKQAGLAPEELWEHSLAVANIARQITLAQTAEARRANDAFTAGLLHDVGRIVLAANLPQEYAAIVAEARGKSRPLHDEEAAQLGVTHAQVGAYLLGLWGMPAPLVEAAAAHHAPSETAAREFSVLTAVHAANVFAHALSPKWDGLALPAIDDAHFAAIGLPDQPEQWRRLVKGEEAIKVASRIAVAKATAPDRAAARNRINWLSRILVPASALLLIVALGVWWARHTDSARPIQVNAKVATQSVPLPPPTSVPIAVSHPEPAAPVETPAAKTPPVEVAPASVSKQPEALGVTPTGESKSTAPVVGFDSVKVQGVFYRTDNPLAVINGKTLKVGERIRGVEVVAIAPSKVTLNWEGELREFKVK